MFLFSMLAHYFKVFSDVITSSINIIFLAFKSAVTAKALRTFFARSFSLSSAYIAVSFWRFKEVFNALPDECASSLAIS